MPDNYPPDIPLWQKGLNVLSWPFQQAEEKIIKPFWSAALSPITPSMPGTEGMPWLERERAEYEAWKAPQVDLGFNYPLGMGRATLGVKGALEMAPWLLSPGLGAVGKAGKVAGVAGKAATTAQLLKRGTLVGGKLASGDPWGLAGALGQAGPKARVAGRIVENLPWALGERGAIAGTQAAGKGLRAIARGPLADQTGAIKIPGKEPGKPKLTDAEILEQAAKGAAPKVGKSGWELLGDAEQFPAPINEINPIDDYYYHVTTPAAAKKILQEGLAPGQRGTMRPGAYAEYSKGKVFLTDRAGILTWQQRIAQHLEESGRSRKLVVVRIPKSSIGELAIDKIGTRDQLIGQSFYSEKPLTPVSSEAAPPVTKGAEVDVVQRAIDKEKARLAEVADLRKRTAEDRSLSEADRKLRKDLYDKSEADAKETLAFLEREKGAEAMPPTGEAVPGKGIEITKSIRGEITNVEVRLPGRPAVEVARADENLTREQLIEKARAYWQGEDNTRLAAESLKKKYPDAQVSVESLPQRDIRSDLPPGRYVVALKAKRRQGQYDVLEAVRQGDVLPGKAVAPAAETIEDIEATVEALEKKWRNAKVRNSTRAGADLEALEARKYDVEEAKDAIQAFKDIVREDFDTAGEFLEARTEAWDEFIDSIGSISKEVEEAAPTRVPGVQGVQRPSEAAAAATAVEGAAAAQRHTLMLRSGGTAPTRMTTTVIPGGEPIALRAAGGGMPPTAPPVGGGGRVPPGGGATPAAGAAVGEWDTGILKFMENWNDIYYGVRKVATKAGKPGVITHLTRQPGEANAGMTRAQLVYEQASKVAPDVGPEPVADFLRLARSAEVLVEKPGRTVPGGFKTLREVEDELARMHASLGDAKWNQVQEAARVVRDAYSFDRQRLVDTGRITQAVADEWAAKYPWYSPWRYVRFAEEQIKQGKSGKVFRTGQGGVYRLGDEGVDYAARSAWEVMPERMVEVETFIGRNERNKAVLGVLRDTGLPITRVKSLGPNVMDIWQNGQRELYQVPEFVYREMAVLSQQVKHPIVDMVGKMNALSRAAYTALSPPFAVANMLNDSLTAFLNRGLLPHETVARLLATVRGLPNDKVMQAFRLSGGYQQRFVELKRLTKDIYATGGQVWRSGPTFKQKLIQAIPAVAERGEQATREAVFKKELGKLLPNWRSMTAEQIAATPQARRAAELAVEATINFGRGAYYIKAANPLIIFLNANMEAVKLPFRALRDNPAARWRLAGAATGVTGLAAYNLSYPEYFDVPDSIRWGSVVVMLPSKEKDAAGNPKPNYVTVIPRTREWATFLGSTTYSMEKMFSDNPTEFGTFTRTITPMVVPFGEIPAPPILQELFAQKANYDFYWQEPVVSADLQVLPEKEQINPWTSRTVSALARGIGISPVRMQHGISTVLGGAGRSVTSVSDFILDMVAPIKRDEAVANFTDEYKQMKPLERIQAMSKLTPDEREAVMRELRQPEKPLPIISPIARRIVPGRGGQLYKTGQEQAAKLLGVSATETSKAGGILRKVSDKLNDEQRALDDRLINNRITWRDWRDERKMLSREYQGALKAVGIISPTAAQVKLDGKTWYDYLATINTVAGTMADRRDRGQMLYAAYRSIQPDEVGDNIDWATYYAQQDTFVASLSSEDKAILEAERLGRMTAVEQVYDKGQQTLRPYWQMVDQAWASYPPEFKLVYQEWQRLQTIDPREAKRFMFQYPQVALAIRRIDMAKKRFKFQNPEVAQLLRMYYSY